MLKKELVIAVFISFNIATYGQLKSIETTPVPIDTVADEVTSPIIISDGGDEVDGSWFIEDMDPSPGWEINKGVYDSDLDSYVDELIGKRKDGDNNNTNSFRLWAPADSGVVWNVSSSKVSFKIKIVDGQDWTFGNEGNLGLYFWVTIWDDYKMDYRSRKVRYNKGPIGVLDEGVHWSDYTPHGLGEDIDDGKWHEVTLDLVHDIQESRDMACNNGISSEACKYWKFYSITALEIRAIHIFLDDIKVLPNTATRINKINNDENVSIYPNPTHGEINITSENFSVKTVKIFDITGRLVKTLQVEGNSVKLDINHLKKGAYFVSVSDGKSSSFQKIIKL